MGFLLRGPPPLRGWGFFSAASASPRMLFLLRVLRLSADAVSSPRSPPLRGCCFSSATLRLSADAVSSPRPSASPRMNVSSPRPSASPRMGFLLRGPPPLRGCCFFSAASASPRMQFLLRDPPPLRGCCFFSAFSASPRMLFLLRDPPPLRGCCFSSAFSASPRMLFLLRVLRGNSGKLATVVALTNPCQQPGQSPAGPADAESK
jgi:hypothetical protein